MGCDITAYLEIKKDGKWEYCNIVSLPRDYRLFSYIAGVRSEHTRDLPPPISNDRGIPSDATDFVKLESNDPLNNHSHGFLTSKEIKDVAEFFKFIHNCFNFVRVLNYFTENEVIEDYRICFYFGG